MTDKVLKTLCAFFLLPVFMLCSCQSTNTEQKINSDFTADFTAEYSDLTLGGTVSANRHSMNTITVTSPDTLSGLCVSYKNSDIHIMRDGLECSADEAWIPSSSFPSVVHMILCGVSQGRQTFVSKNDNILTYTLSLSAGNCTLKTDKDGNLLSAQTDSPKCKIEFSNLKVTQTQ